MYYIYRAFEKKTLENFSSSLHYVQHFFSFLRAHVGVFV